MKMAIKSENDEFLVITHKHVLGLTGHANRPKTLKLWPIAHENDHKHENVEFLVINLKVVSGLTGHANRPRIPKLWTTALENGHKTRKLRVFGPNSQTCIGSYGRCKSICNPKTVGNSS